MACAIRDNVKCAQSQGFTNGSCANECSYRTLDRPGTNLSPWIPTISLLQNGADKTLKDLSGRNALWYAVLFNRTEFAQFLLGKFLFES